MAQIIQIKRGTGSSVPSSLAEAELAINLDSGKLYYGSGSSVVSNFTFDSITAETYIISSSVTHMTTSFSSGSTAFGDSSADQHTFTGHITASGNISASGNLITENLQVDTITNQTAQGGIVLDADGFIGIDSKIGDVRFRDNGVNQLHFDMDGTVGAQVISPSIAGDDLIFKNQGGSSVLTLKSEGQTEIHGNITASGNISSSGTVTANSIVGTLATVAQTNITSVGTLGSLTVTGDITANGDITGDNNTTVTGLKDVTIVRDLTVGSNISASGTITMLTASIGGGIFTSASLAAGGSDENFTTTLKNKLDAIEASADVTDTTNVTSAGALMDSELTDLAAVKAINQSLVTTANVLHNDITASGNISSSNNLYSKRAYFYDDNSSYLASGTNPILHLKNTNAGTNADAYIKFESTDNGSHYSLGIDTSRNTFVIGSGSYLTQDSSPPFSLKDDKIAINKVGGLPSYTLDVTGDIRCTDDLFVNDDATISGDITASGNVSASGTVTANSLVGTLATAAQTNITSVGTLGSLTVTGNITANGNIVGDDGTSISNIAQIELDNLYFDGDGTTGLEFGANDIHAVNSDGNTLLRLQNSLIEIGHADATITNGIKLAYNVTASSNISASGTITADKVVSDNIQSGWHGSTTRIKILVSDFIPDDIGRPAMIDDTGSDRWLESHGTGVLFASISIPTGFKATHIRIYGSGTSAMEVSEMNINSKTVTSKGTGNIGTELNMTDVTSSTTNYLFIELAQASGEEVYGGYVTIAAV